jgi:hypothetical protein
LKFQIIIILSLEMGFIETSDEFAPEFVAKTGQAKLEGIGRSVANQKATMAVIDFAAGGSRNDAAGVLPPLLGLEKAMLKDLTPT